MNFYEFNTFLEGKIEDLINQNPDLKYAYDNGIKNFNYLNWITKVKGDEPIRDIVPVLLAFEKNKRKLIRKDLMSFKSVGELRNYLEETIKTKEQKRIELNNSDTTFLGKFGKWYVIMPHTKESSCYWGKDTTWCTAYTVSGNMFFHYSAFEKVTLFYLIEESANTRKNPESKLSVGFLNGEINYENNSTVDSANNDLNEEDLKRILGSQYESIMSSIKKHAGIMEDNHPSRNIMKRIAQGDGSIRELEDESALGNSFAQYDNKVLIRGIAQYDLTIDGVWEILRHTLVFGQDEESVQDIITYSKNTFETAKLLIDYFRLEKDRIKGKFVSVILRFGSINAMNGENLTFNFDKLEELMRLLGAKNLYLLSYAEVKELFAVVSQRINIEGLKKGEITESKLRSLFAKYSPEWDKDHIDAAINSSYKDNIKLQK